MATALRSVLVLLCFTVLGGCSRSYEWREQVRLSSGETLWVQRGARLAPEGEATTAQYTRPLQMQIDPPDGAKPWRGEEWPLSLDRVDGQWWVVMEVSGYFECERYGFPPDSMVAFALDRGGWARRSASHLLERITVNLDEPALHRGEPEHGVLSWERKRPDGSAAPTLAEHAARGAAGRDACGKIQPPPDPRKDASLAEFARLASALRSPVVESVETDLPKLSVDELRRARGAWTGSAYLQHCEGIVENVEALYRWEKHGTAINTTIDTERIDFVGAEPGVEPHAFVPALPPAGVAAVACNAGRVFAVFSNGPRGRFSIVEYSREGQPLAAFSYGLGAALEQHVRGFRGSVAELADEGEAFSLLLVDDESRARARVRLPKTTPPDGSPEPIAVRR